MEEFIKQILQMIYFFSEMTFKYMGFIRNIMQTFLFRNEDS